MKRFKRDVSVTFKAVPKTNYYCTYELITFI